MTYNKWANEYETQMAELNIIIERLRKEKSACINISDIESYNSRINSIYSMYLECMHTAKLLRKRDKERWYL